MPRTKQKNWYKLDNAAKIIPATIGGPDTRVFRLVCELKEDVDPEILQIAVNETSREFPHMNCCLRSGIFWYYLDESKEKPIVTEDQLPALSALYKAGRKNLLYRINIIFGLMTILQYMYMNWSMVITIEHESKSKENKYGRHRMSFLQK